MLTILHSKLFFSIKFIGDTMKLSKLINDYVECNNFEIKIDFDKVKIYYYDKIECFSSSKVVVLCKDKKVIINGKKLVVETMFEEYMIISGNINSIELGNDD